MAERPATFGETNSVRPYRTFPVGLLIVPLGIAVAACGEPASKWKPAPAPLMTRWAKDVSPVRVRPEYPRPLFVRKDWKSLNGLWEFAFDDSDQGRTQGWQSGKALPEQILVPFTFEAALSGIGRGKEVHEHVWYRRSFEVPSGWHGRHVRLNFNACDWQTTVWVNGRELGQHRGGYEPFSFDVTEALKKSGPQEVVVAVYDPADPRSGAYQPKGKQLGSEGIFYTRTTGIWQSVWLEPFTAAAPEPTAIRTEVSPTLREGRLFVTFRPAGAQSGAAASAELTLSRDGHEVAHTQQVIAAGAGPVDVSVPVSGCDLWSPESPALYDLAIRVREGGRTVDQVRSYCAFRSYDIEHGRLALNGKPYFFRGVLDQGYWPDGILTPPTDDAIRNDVQMLKRFGLNMARKHVKVEDPRWYYWCDHLGVAVWQDMPSSHNLVSAEAKANFRREWTGVVRTTESYPCVLHWIPFNENWGNPGPFQDEIVRLTRRLDPTRPITDASGWTQRGLTDVVDAHDYSNNLLKQGVEHPVKPKVVGEYGGIALPEQGHTWTTGWGYQTVRNSEGLIRRIRSQTTQLFEAPNLSGYVYTQLTDVEQELNGLMTYDRIPKADPAKLAAVFEGKDRSHADVVSVVHDWLLLGAVRSGTDLRSAANSDANRAQIRGILDHPFLPAEANLTPTEGEGVAADRTEFRWTRFQTEGDVLDFNRIYGDHENAVVYAVAYLQSPREHKDVTLLLGSDDGARVWLNGTQVWTVDNVRGVSPDSDLVPHLTLKAGRNVLVVKVAQGVGGWGLTARFETADGHPLALQP